jgi:hypothetical protein
MTLIEIFYITVLVGITIFLVFLVKQLSICASLYHTALSLFGEEDKVTIDCHKILQDSFWVLLLNALIFLFVFIVYMKII